MRIDKFISNLGYASRKQIAKYIKDWHIGVNSETIYEKEYQIKFWDIISIWEESVEFREFIYLILNKKSWFVSSKKPEWAHPSYLDMINDCPYSNVIDIVWRLDYDTTWLLFLTNNWDLTHKIIHPKKDIFKKYKVTSKNPLIQKDIQKLETWVKIDDFITKPSKVEMISENEFYLSISEWKFHQIKKMLEAINNEVTSLHRVSIWSLELGDLEIWKWRYLGDEEVKKLIENL